MNIRALSEPVLDKFRKIFFKTFSRKQNASFVGKVRAQSAQIKVFSLFFFFEAAFRCKKGHIVFFPSPSKLELALARERWDVLLQGLRNALVRVS